MPMMMADNNWDFSFNEFSADDEELSIDLESFYSILGEDPDPMQVGFGNWYCFIARGLGLCTNKGNFCGFWICTLLIYCGFFGGTVLV